MKPDDDDDKPRLPFIEQWWLGLVALGILATAVMLLLLSRADGAECTLAWDMPPATEQVTSWKVFRGIELLATVSVNTATLDLPRDQLSTLSVIAVRGAQQSAPANISVIPFTPKYSEDLRVWIARPDKCFFVEAKPRMFASYSFPSP